MSGLMGDGQNNNWVGKISDVVIGMFSSLFSIIGNVVKFAWNSITGSSSANASEQPPATYTAAPPTMQPLATVDNPNHGLSSLSRPRPTYKSLW